MADSVSGGFSVLSRACGSRPPVDVSVFQRKKTFMSTTALFVELLIVGLESLVWIFLFISGFFGIDWLLGLINIFEKAGLFLTVVLIGFAYLIGILLDELFDSLTGWWSNRIKSSIHDKDLPQMWDMQAYIFGHSKEATEQLGYIRTRVRIMRSSIFNFGLIGIGAILFVSNQISSTNYPVGRINWVNGIICLLLVSITSFIYWRLENAYWFRVMGIYKSLMSFPKEPVKSKQKGSS